MNDIKSLLVEETGNSNTNDETGSDNNEVLQRYARLHEENPDFAGWIQIPDTTIDYPVMYVEGDNDAYLHSNFNKEYDAGGVPFIDGYCSINPVSEKMCIRDRPWTEAVGLSHHLLLNIRKFHPCNL